jgi:capsular exopolysaccharide synthesis family protein
MDDLAPYRGAHAPIAPASRGGGAPAAYPAAAPAAAVGTPYGPDLAAVKTPADYLGALRRRAWLALIVAVPLGTLASIHALRQPRIYQAVGQIRIEAPHFDSALSALVARDMGQTDTTSQTTYAADKVTDLQYGRVIAERVLARNQFGPEVAQMDDPAAELIISNIGVKPVPKSNTYTVTLNGRDPALTKRLLEAMLEETVKSAKDEQVSRVRETVENARRALRTLTSERDDRESQMIGQIEALGTIGPGGRNILEEQYARIGQSIELQQARIGELQQKMMFAPLFPREEAVSPRESAARQQREQLEGAKQDLVEHLDDLRRKTRNFDSDPAVKRVARQLHKVMDAIDEIDDSFATKTKMAADPTEMIQESLQRDVESRQAQQQEMLARMQKAMPDHQKFLYLMEDHASIRKQIDDMTGKLQAFEILAESQAANPPVKVVGSIAEPTKPIKPNRPMLIGMGLIVSLGLGLGLVFLLEHIDHSVRVPEHVSHGLGLPLLGVVPRTPRTALTHRGGHLWTAGAPDSAAADAFRNVRAGLLGAADRGGPIVSLLVSSAKAGEGKSTTALNLAAACARAGERTLLLDVDLRRPTLDAAFPAEEGEEDGRLGLVDVLKGEVPWQATLRRTDLHNLDFIAAGDPREVPIEILGTLELRQLLTALTHHYDRVILDGPAVLGMADCRVLGRMVDAAVLVVRAGAHQTVTLQRAKAVLEQSRVEIAGVIVNGLSDGAHHWSSHAYGPAAVAAYRRDRALPAAEAASAHA